MKTIDQDAEDVLINALAIARQSVDEKEQRIQTLLKRVEWLEETLTRISTQRVPQPQLAPALKPAPRRWSVR